MLHDLNNTIIDDEEVVSFCEYWLEEFPKRLIANLTDIEVFYELQLLRLIKYEILHKKRLDLLKRLTARYNKLRRNREWKIIEEHMAC